MSVATKRSESLEILRKEAREPTYLQGIVEAGRLAWLRVQAQRKDKLHRPSNTFKLRREAARLAEIIHLRTAKQLLVAEIEYADDLRENCHIANGKPIRGNFQIGARLELAAEAYEQTAIIAKKLNLQELASEQLKLVVVCYQEAAVRYRHSNDSHSEWQAAAIMAASKAVSSASKTDMDPAAIMLLAEGLHDMIDLGELAMRTAGK